MDTATQSQIFFLISSIGFIILGVLAAVLLVYLVRISHTFARIIERAEEDIDKIGDTTKEMLEEVRDSSLFQFLFKLGKRKRRKELK